MSAGASAGAAAREHAAAVARSEQQQQQREEQQQQHRPHLGVIVRGLVPLLQPAHDRVARAEIRPKVLLLSAVGGGATRR